MLIFDKKTVHHFLYSCPSFGLLDSLKIHRNWILVKVDLASFRFIYSYVFLTYIIIIVHHSFDLLQHGVLVYLFWIIAKWRVLANLIE